MFDSTNFCTFEPMQDALIHSVSSQQSLHPAEHAIMPLEPNMAWEANAENEYHQIVIDLREQRSIDGLLLIHHESTYLPIVVEYSNNASSWTQVWLTGFPYGLSSPFITLFLLRLAYFWNPDTLQTLTISARYWRITFYGDITPDYYPPSDMRVSACWFFTKHELNSRGILPLNQQIVFPANIQTLPFGKQYVTGQSVNASGIFSRTWFVTDIERALLWQIISKCNGAFRPFILIENEIIEAGEIIRHLCRFNTSTITESLIDVGLIQITAQLTEIPIVKHDAKH